jgi:pyruvate/2-oxoglutarate/acetoin dehydrogenase E1 component
MRTLNMSQAINEALREEMNRDAKVIILGEDVGQFGGAFQVTKKLLDEFGADRVRDTPLSEAAIIGCAIGAAIMGYRPVAEIQYSDFVACGFDQLVNQAAKIHLMSGGQVCVPMVVRLPIGAKDHGAQHDQSPEAWFMHTPGLKVVIPSTPYDAKGLLKTAIRDPNPVVFCEHKVLYGTQSVGGRGLPDQVVDSIDSGSQVPEEDYQIPFGQADIKRTGKDLTIVATALMVPRALRAAQILAAEGIEIEVFDPRTLVPFDQDALIGSVKKTHRLLIVTEETLTASCSAEIAAIAAEYAFDWLDAPIIRLGTPDIPMPFAPAIQEEIVPNVERILCTARDLVEKRI